MTAGERAQRRDAVAQRSSVEVELKFDVLDLAATRALIEADHFGGLAATTPIAVVNSVDRYLDTASGTLQRAGWVARLRSSGEPNGEAILALKTTARRSSGAVHRREELEGPASLATPPADWPPSPARERLLALVGDLPLQAVIVLDQRRRQRLYGDGQVEVEVSLDRVRTMVGDRIVDRNLVLEVELKSGPEARLVRLGEDLGRLPFLLPSATSKLARSLAAAERTRLQAVLPDLTVVRTPGVRGEDTVAEAGRKVIAFHFARMLAREPGTREGRDAEELHQMRVATRRMRAAWRVFGDGFDPRATRAIRTQLREVATALGAVRDLDVLLEHLAADTAGLAPSDADGMQPLVVALRAERDEARRRLIRMLERAAHQRWIERSIAFLSTPGKVIAKVQAGTPRRVRDTAPSRIWLAYEQVRAYGEVLRRADIATLHALRIAGKRLRYAIEFVQEALGADGAVLVQRVTALQDHLGLLNDADVAAARARAFLAEHGPQLSQHESDVIGRYLVGRGREIARLRRTIGRSWAGVEGTGFRRHLGRALARL